MDKSQNGAALTGTVQPLVSSFRMLALGTRFTYAGHDKVWVKLSNDGTIAEWDDANINTGWLGQSICCLNDEEPIDLKQDVWISC